MTATRRGQSIKLKILEIPVNNLDGCSFLPPETRTSMKTDTTLESKNDAAFIEKQSFLKRLFGCWHSRMSKPVTIDQKTFCYCKDCGLRRKFDTRSFRLEGAFYSERPGKTVNFV